jgi:hypothetical protein
MKQLIEQITVQARKRSISITVGSLRPLQHRQLLRRDRSARQRSVVLRRKRRAADRDLGHLYSSSSKLGSTDGAAR